MIDTALLAKVLRLSSEMRAESRKVGLRAREAISQSTVIIDQSRALLSQWPVSGDPQFPEKRDSSRSAEDTKLGSFPAVSSPPALERVADRDFTDEIVLLDGKHFVDCNVADCTLEYGGGPLVLEGTHFTGCRFRFFGAAAMTVSMLDCFGLTGNQQLGLPETDALSAAVIVN